MKCDLIILMAGQGSRFSERGYPIPKPFIPIYGVPMFQRVLNNLTSDSVESVTVAVQSAHIPHLPPTALARGLQIVQLHGNNEGAACTVLEVLKQVEFSNSIVLCNSDQIVDFDFNSFLQYCAQSKCDGCILTMKTSGTQWSYVKRDESGTVQEVAEKREISDEATIGIYYFRNAKILESAIEEMIQANERTNGEFYLAPCYNALLRKGYRIDAFHVGEKTSVMYELGTPDALEASLQNPSFQKVVERDQHRCS